ncbi:hypothetical protein B0H14DRAFT_2572934 [Mycena olivaceomarginata]|nr:hypothetical protein B0H14DRAFT_2572934 [Mycena olivaceomarginata]
MFAHMSLLLLLLLAHRAPAADIVPDSDSTMNMFVGKEMTWYPTDTGPLQAVLKSSRRYKPLNYFKNSSSLNPLSNLSTSNPFPHCTPEHSGHILTEDQDTHGAKTYELDENPVDTFQEGVDALIEAGTKDALGMRDDAVCTHPSCHEEREGKVSTVSEDFHAARSEAPVGGADDGFGNVSPVGFRLVEEFHAVDANLLVDEGRPAQSKIEILSIPGCGSG